MKKRILYLSLILSLTFMLSCEQEVEEDFALKDRIGKIADKVLVDSATVPFSLTGLTDYSWDEALILTPYTQLDKVRHVTRADLRAIEKTGIELDDGKNVIAFISNGKLISYVDLPRGSGDFAYLNDSVLLYPFGEAEFKMVKENGRAVVKKMKY